MPVIKKTCQLNYAVWRKEKKDTAQLGVFSENRDCVSDPLTGHFIRNPLYYWSSIHVCSVVQKIMHIQIKCSLYHELGHSEQGMVVAVR